MRIAAKAIVGFAIFAGFSGSVALAQKDFDPAETRCMRADDSIISSLLSQIDYADQNLPNIPPEEQRYLDAESAAAARMYKDESQSEASSYARSTQIYRNLYSRPLYTVWAFRKTIEPARSALKRVLKQQPNPALGDPDYITYKKNPEAEKLERAAPAISAVGQYTIALQNLLTKIGEQNYSSITQSQWTRLLGSAYGASYDLPAFIECKLAKIMGRQTFDLR